MAEMLRRVGLRRAQSQFVLRCLAESGGGSAREFGAIYAGGEEPLERAAAALQAALDGDKEHVGLSEADWRAVFDAVNATIYALGPSELVPLTSFDLSEAADVQLRICADVWGANSAETWSGFS